MLFSPLSQQKSNQQYVKPSSIPQIFHSVPEIDSRGNLSSQLRILLAESKKNKLKEHDQGPCLASLIDSLVQNLPPPDPNALIQMQRTCELQEQKVLTKLSEYRHLDVYEEMKSVSDELYGLKFMGQEELNQVYRDSIERINRMNTRREEQNTSSNSFSIPIKDEEEEIENVAHSQGEIKEKITNISLNKFTRVNQNSFVNNMVYESLMKSLNEEVNENEDPTNEDKNPESNQGFKGSEDFGSFSQYLGMMSRKVKKINLDFNNIHNFLDENDGNDINEACILREIDMNENQIRLYD